MIKYTRNRSVPTGARTLFVFTRPTTTAALFGYRVTAFSAAQARKGLIRQFWKHVLTDDEEWGALPSEFADHAEWRRAISNWLLDNVGIPE